MPSERPDPFAVLGLSRDATVDEVRQARNRLAKAHHPDVGGTAERMQELNDAAAAAIGRIEAGPTVAERRRRGQPQRGVRPERAEPRRGRVERDHPSFTIEALPAVAFEGLVLAARILGDVADDEPPYRIDMVLDDPWQVWCRAELVPDGGGSTVSLTVVDTAGSFADAATHDVVTSVRDRLLDELNGLDWTTDGPRRRPPS